jgi:hypothetical protein
MDFKVGQKVKVITRDSGEFGRLGFISEIDLLNSVQSDWTIRVMFHPEMVNLWYAPFELCPGLNGVEMMIEAL